MDCTLESTGAPEQLMAHFVELPRLRLTAAQAAKLLGIDRTLSENLVEQLLAAAFLRRMPDGSVMRAGA